MSNENEILVEMLKAFVKDLAAIDPETYLTLGSVIGAICGPLVLNTCIGIPLEPEAAVLYIISLLAGGVVGWVGTMVTAIALVVVAAIVEYVYYKYRNAKRIVDARERERRSEARGWNL